MARTHLQLASWLSSILRNLRLTACDRDIAHSIDAVAVNKTAIRTLQYCQITIDGTVHIIYHNKVRVCAKPV